MKNQNELLTHQEIMDGLTTCFRQLIGTEISHRNMPNIINRGKAAAALVTAAHREEVMEGRRLGASSVIKSAEGIIIKKLGKNNV